MKGTKVVVPRGCAVPGAIKSRSQGSWARAQVARAFLYQVERILTPAELAVFHSCGGFQGSPEHIQQKLLGDAKTARMVSQLQNME